MTVIIWRIETNLLFLFMCWDILILNSVQIVVGTTVFWNQVNFYIICYPNKNSFQLHMNIANETLTTQETGIIFHENLIFLTSWIHNALSSILTTSQRKRITFNSMQFFSALLWSVGACPFTFKIVTFFLFYLGGAQVCPVLL